MQEACALSPQLCMGQAGAERQHAARPAANPGRPQQDQNGAAAHSLPTMAR